MIRFLPVPLAFFAAWTLTSTSLLAAPPANNPAANGSASTNAAPAPAAASSNAAAAPVPGRPSLYDLTVNSIDGKPVALAQYRGHVVLVVNTASNGGFTGQYKGLEQLYEQYKDKGFSVLAFPCNDFGAQEPGSAKDIATFCKTRFDVTFPLFEKVKTQGPGQSPVYQFVTAGHGKPQWNFHKYLIDKNGQVIGEFPDRTGPDSAELRAAIDAALKS
jgi:glutathione peroxidase